MIRRQSLYWLAAVASLMAVARGQALKGDDSFPMLNEMRWEMSLVEVKNLCAAHQSLETGTDTTVIAGMNYFGFPTRIQIMFLHGSPSINSITVKFKSPTRQIADTLINHFTRLTGKEPLRQTKEKSLLIVTLRMELSGWKLRDGTVSLIAAKHNDDIFDLFLTLLPASKQKS